jgi:hypothetical protein
MGTADLIGWAATVVFAASYFCVKANALRRVQIVGALMWTAYGVLSHAAPVVGANLLLVGVALWTARRTAAPAAEPSLGRGRGTPRARK